MTTTRRLGKGEPFENKGFLEFLRFLHELEIIPLIFTKGHVIGNDELVVRYFKKYGIKTGESLVKELKRLNVSIMLGFNSFDKSIQETQNNFEQFGQDVQTNLDIIGTGITNFFGGIFPTKEITTVSEATPTIISRRAGTTTRFGGQTAPKEILTKETATTQEVIVSEQPDLTKLSPFLSIQSFAKAVTDKPELITVEQEATTSRFSGSGSFR